MVAGTLENVREYAECHFGHDEDQKQAFKLITASFLMEVHRIARDNDDGSMPRRKKTKLKHVMNKLANVNRDPQLLMFLSGAGGSGKSHVIKTVVKYARKLHQGSV